MPPTRYVPSSRCIGKNGWHENQGTKTPDVACPHAASVSLICFSTAVRQKMGTMLMSDIFHRSLIPSPYRLPERALSYVQYVIINWLDVEVDETAPEWRPLLNGLTGWRRFITICNVLRQIGRRACTGVRRPISRHQAT